MYQVKISHRHSPLASQPSLSFSLVWHIPKVQTLEQFHRWTWNVVMSIFNAFIYNTNTSFSSITLHYSHNILHWVEFCFTTLLIIFILVWIRMSRRRNADSAQDSISTHFSETNLAQLFHARGFAQYSVPAGQSQTFAWQNPVFLSRRTHISSPIHDEKTVHEAVQVHKNAS